MASLIDVLNKVKRGPIQIDERGQGGAILAFVLHCLMVKHGYQPHPFNRQNPAAPVVDWNNRYKDEWVFEFSRKGYDSVFVLHCSLQAATGKMFVQGREKDNSTHMHNLGLQVEKYIAGPERCTRSSWEGVLESEDVLDDMFREYIAEPLRKQAVPAGKQAATAYDRSVEWLKKRSGDLQRRDVLVPVGLGVATVVVIAATVYVHKRRSSVA